MDELRPLRLPDPPIATAESWRQTLCGLNSATIPVVHTVPSIMGMLPASLGLVVVMPVLGHATCRLYRRIVAPAA